MGGKSFDLLKLGILEACDDPEVTADYITINVHDATDCGNPSDPPTRRRHLSDPEQTIIDTRIQVPWDNRKDWVETTGHAAVIQSKLQNAIGTPQKVHDFFAYSSGGFLDLEVLEMPNITEYIPKSFLEDPHMRSGHGDMFDFKGEHDAVYNLLSHANISVNAHFQHVDYISPGLRKKIVHGSYMRTAYLRVLTNASRTVQAEYAAAHPLSAWVRLDGVDVWGGARLKIDNVLLVLQSRTFTVTTPEWLVRVSSKVNPDIINATTCATGRCILNVQLEPLFDTDHAKVAPHGLIGQSFDADDIAVVGKADRYNLQESTTSAMGEGAIEGVAVQYKVMGAFATQFAFSRFGKVSALSRNVSLLTGTKMMRVDRVSFQT